MRCAEPTSKILRHIAGAAVAALALAGLLACAGRVAADDTSGATVSDAALDGDPDAAPGSLASGRCEPSGDRCIGDSRCCPPVAGLRIDLARSCAARAPTSLLCEPPTGPPVTDTDVKRCARAEESTCFARPDDAGSGGEVYWLPYWLEALPGYEPCDDDLRARASDALGATCP